MKLIDTRDAVGHVLCHDLTQIIPGVTKDARFRKGHVVAPEDIPVLLSMGKQHLYVWEKAPGMLHEDEAAKRLRALCQNEHMHPTPVKEGKIELIADRDGLFQVDVARLAALNGASRRQAGGHAHHPAGHIGGSPSLGGGPGRERPPSLPDAVEAEDLRPHHHRQRGGQRAYSGRVHARDHG